MMLSRKYGQQSGSNDVQDGRPTPRGREETATPRGQGETAPVNSRTKRLFTAVGRALLKLIVHWARRAQAASPHGPWIHK